MIDCVCKSYNKSHNPGEFLIMNFKNSLARKKIKTKIQAANNAN